MEHRREYCDYVPLEGFPQGRYSVTVFLDLEAYPTQSPSYEHAFVDIEGHIEDIPRGQDWISTLGRVWLNQLVQYSIERKK